MPETPDSPLILRLVDRIEAESRRSGLSAARICTLAVNDGKLMQRLTSGASCTVATYEKFMGWLDSREAGSSQRECAA